MDMIKSIPLFLLLMFSGTCAAQHYSEQFGKEKIKCYESPAGNYLHLHDILPGLYDVYIISDICSLVAGSSESASGLNFLKEEAVIKVKDSYYILPVRLNYQSTLPVSYYLPDTESNLIVITFEVMSHIGLIGYNYMLLDFAADGRIYCFEVDSKVKLTEEKIITKYSIAGIAGVIPIAEKIENN